MPPRPRARPTPSARTRRPTLRRRTAGTAGLRALIGHVSRDARALAARPDAPPGIRIVQRAIDPLEVAALATDDHGRYVAVNDVACEVTGFTRRELHTMSVWQLTPEAHGHDAEILWRAFLQRKQQHGEYELLTRKGDIVKATYAACTHVVPGVHLSLLAPPRRRARQS